MSPSTTHRWAVAYDAIGIQRYSNNMPELAGFEGWSAFVFFHMGSHFKDALAEILDWYPLAEAFGHQQTITTLGYGACQIVLTLDFGRTILVHNCPPVVDLNLCTYAPGVKFHVICA
jgi:hypothetical protein